jgi:hypothetical protein
MKQRYCKWGFEEYIWQGSFLVFFLWAPRACTTDFCPALAALVVIQYKTLFFLMATYSLAGQSWAVMPDYLSLNKCLWVVGTLAGQAVVPHYLPRNKCLWAVGTCSLAGQAAVPH